MIAEALRRRAEAMELELAGGDTPLPVRMLAERVVSARLEVHFVEVTVTAGRAPDDPKPAQARLDSAERRFLKATAALATVRKLLPLREPSPVAPAPLAVLVESREPVAP